MKSRTWLLIPLACLVMLPACTSLTNPPPAYPRSQWRPVEAMPQEVFADTITVGTFRQVCDVLARNLVIQPFITQAANPPVIAVRKIENKTDAPVDATIFQETIRVKLMEHAGGTVLFRDDVSYQDIVKERLQQSNEDITVTLTDSMVQTRTHDRLREREYDTGALSGLGGAYENADNIEHETAMETEQTGTVKGKIADADYFLRGIIYQMNERNAAQPVGGMTYYQYQFRVTDARTGLIVWEKMLDSKLEGAYESSMIQPTQAAAQQNLGQVPQGWPTTPQATGSTQQLTDPNAQNQAAQQQAGTQTQQANIPSWP